jgi:hypothetical protein
MAGDLIVWGLLAAASLLSWGISDSGHASWQGVAVLAVALVKVRLIVRYYMEVRTAPLALRVGADAWLLGMAGGLIGLYFF